MTTPRLGFHCSTMVDTPSIGGWLPIWPLRQSCCVHLELALKGFAARMGVAQWTIASY